MRARRTERHAGENVEKIGLAGQIKCRAFGPRFMRLAEPRPYGRGYYCTCPSGLTVNQNGPEHSELLARAEGPAVK